jgi:hypothetical protein
MAVTAAPWFTNPTSQSWQITATADGDTGIDIPHDLGGSPQEFWIQPLAPAARISDWVVDSANANTINIRKTTTAGSGFAGVQAIVFVRLPHSIAK